VKHIILVRKMNKKKNGEVLVFLLACFSVGIIAGSISKNKFKKNISQNSLTIQNYVNRLSEFDLTETKSASELFFDLMSTGFHPQSAFDIVAKECIDVGEKFND
jgi:hypothetical protein